MKIKAEDVLKALEICTNHKEDCTGCPFAICDELCSDNLDKACYKVITDLLAENERLLLENVMVSQKRANIFEIIKSYDRGRKEAVKEFADNLFDEINQIDYSNDSYDKADIGEQIELKIETLLKEMTECKGL